ncbi:MCE family protein, partial [Bordetella hinzii]|nr:MCE family protein [Bordetella hinzii]
MENRSHALLAGIFTLVLLAAAALVAVWVGRDRSTVKVYDIVSSAPVSGLTA